MHCVIKFLWVFFSLFLLSCRQNGTEETIVTPVVNQPVQAKAWEGALDALLKAPSIKVDEGEKLKIKLQNATPFTEETFLLFVAGLKELYRVLPVEVMRVELEGLGSGATYKAVLSRADSEAYAEGKISQPEWVRRANVEEIESLESLKQKIRAARAAGDPESAKPLLLKWLVSEPNSPAAMSVLGNVYRDEKNYADAAEVYQKILAADPRSLFALHNLGYVHAEQGVYAEAIGDYTKALEVDPANPVLMRQLAEVYRKNGALDSARSWIEKALPLGETAEARVIEGNIHRDAKRFKEAGEGYARAAALSKADSRVLFNRILIELDLKNFEEAKKKFGELRGKDAAMAEEMKIVSIFAE